MNAENSDPLPPAENSASPARAADAFREGDYLVVRKVGAKLPAGRVFCNAPEVKRQWLKVRKFDLPFIVWLLFFGYLLILLYSLSPKAKFEAGLCSSHLQTRRPYNSKVVALLTTVLVMLIGGSVVSIASPLESIASGVGALFMLPGLILLPAMLPYFFAPRSLLKGFHADRGFMWVDGVSPDYLQRLPEIGGQ